MVLKIMSLDNKEVADIAHLARIGVGIDELEDLGKELSGILELVAQMEKVDTSNVAPMAHPMDMTQRLRADEITEENQREQLQQNAPSTESGLFLVPKVIE